MHACMHACMHAGYIPQFIQLIQKIKDWELPYLFFAYHTKFQGYTKESPFYLLYGRDPRIPSELPIISVYGRFGRLQVGPDK
jgi:hypothetical protein